MTTLALDVTVAEQTVFQIFKINGVIYLNTRGKKTI